MKKPYYKYRPLHVWKDDGSKRNAPFTESIFTKAEIYYSAPADCNDPFDCNLKTHVNNSTDAEWGAYIDHLISIFPAKRPQLLQIKADKAWDSHPELKDIGKNQQKFHYLDSSVFCLSKKCNSTPMFSYYADGHTGVAIEFSFSDNEVPCGIDFRQNGANGVPYAGKVVFRDVEYPAAFPELNYHKLYGSDKLVRHLIFTKSPEWAHEEEFRIFRRKVPKSAVSFDRKLLTRVIFGCKTKDADVDLVKGWLNGWPSDVVLSKTEPATDRFELIVTDFDVVRGT